MEERSKAERDAQESIGDTTHHSFKKEADVSEEVRHSRRWALTYAVLLLIFTAAYFVIAYELLPVPDALMTAAIKICRIGIFSSIVLLASRLADHFLICPIKDISSRYNLRRLNQLLTVLLVILIVVTIIFVNWYAAAVSLGLISLILGFALQTPITSFIGWIYILVKKPYQVGDRIKLDEVKGDVIGIGYLDTTLWEFGGDYLSTDHPSGRIIRFPNSKVLESVVYNYSWDYFPYIWNEVKMQVAYDSDFRFVAQTMQELAEQELGEDMKERIITYRELISRTAIDKLEVKEHPTVLFKVHDNTWIEVIVRYLVEPRTAGRIKSDLTHKVLEALNAQPERVRFPKGDAR